MPRQTLLDLFIERQSIARPFLVYDDGFRSWTLTSQEVAAGAYAFAERLRGHGVQAGGKVILWGENRPGWLVALWGCLLEGVLAVPIDFRSSPAFVDRVAGIVGASVVVCGDEVPARTGAWLMSEIERDRRPLGRPHHQPNREETAEILFTSGATAEPKGVLISHRNLLANLVPVETEIQKYRGHWAVRFLAEPFLFPVRFLNLLPLSHLFGQTMAAFISPMIDGEVIFSRSHSPPDLVQQIKRRRISVVVCVPKMMELLRDHVIRLCPEAGLPLPPGGWPGPAGFLRNWWIYRRVHRMLGWKFWALIVGAAPLDPELEAFWRKLGYVVIQGYGLTETAPMVSINHPFQASHGSVGRPVAGVEVKLADDGEILVKGENITAGYYGVAGGVIAADGWFHTGDVGELDPAGAIRIRGRKKEMIVTPEGLNIFPDDLERVLLTLPGVADAAVVEQGQRPHAVLVLASGMDGASTVAAANTELEGHQRIRGHSVWPPGSPLPRTEGTRKLKRAAIAEWVRSGAREAVASGGTGVAAVLARYSGGRAVTPATTVADLGLSSLERVQLLLELEEKLGRPLDETALASATVSGIEQLQSQPPAAQEPIRFARWARCGWARAIRRVSLLTWILPLSRIFLWVRAKGLDHLADTEGPVIFASNHQSFLDTPAILLALPPQWRYRVSPAMRMEFFDAYFHPEKHGWAKRFRNSLGYYLASLMLQAFPLPQREAGTKQALRYAGELVSEGTSILIFPEGKHSDDDTVGPFQPGVAMMAIRLGVPVVPVRVRGVNQVLHPSWKMARPGRVSVHFGAPLKPVLGEDYGAFAARLSATVKNL